MCALESFVGVLYAGFCGALLFAKILRVQAVAQVTFSNALAIHYDNKEKPQAADDKDKLYPCPMLAVRIINDYANRRFGGELFGANVEAIVMYQEDQNTNGKRSSGRKNSRSSKGRGGRKALMGAIKCNSDGYNYAKVEWKISEHPLFNSTWIIHHELNESSPFLTDEMKADLQLQDGKCFWPADKFTSLGIRNGLKNFTKLAITFNAVSGSSFTSVYAQYPYEFEDIVVGYVHAKATYADAKTGMILVDRSLRHDVIEQEGGGAESLDDSDSTLEV
eukprot:CAMPEP_0116004892 /NCGR_PEP_ID=MMETSP0321-20121206/857_1 /TAXON_ID=163516 /ORGANISM="Leptocylindrus danicus var. danicus, Strain B650" /LENGTH=276 /DNA_ID=CAMNT_0003473249 /DNA_START=645 /DNA_END=1475 /DNA_ORIENTATION=+